MNRNIMAFTRINERMRTLTSRIKTKFIINVHAPTDDSEQRKRNYTVNWKELTIVSHPMKLKQ